MRINHKIIKIHANYVNLSLKNYEIRANRRNGYYAVDVYIKGGGLYNTLYVGTAREAYIFISGMIEGTIFKDMMKPF